MSTVPTSSPISYVLSFQMFNTFNETLTFEPNVIQSAIAVSHDDTFMLWAEGEVASRSMQKYVQTGNTNQISDELANGLQSDAIDDFIVTDEVIGVDNNQTVVSPDISLLVESDQRFISLAAKIIGENTSDTPLFTGASAISACQPVPLPSSNESFCEFWSDEITLPLYVYMLTKVEADDDVNTTTSRKQKYRVRKAQEEGQSQVQIGFLTLNKTIGKAISETQVVDDNDNYNGGSKRRNKTIPLLITGGKGRRMLTIKMFHSFYIIFNFVSQTSPAM